MLNIRAHFKTVAATCAGIAVMLVVPSLYALSCRESVLPFLWPIAIAGCVAIVSMFARNPDFVRVGQRDGVVLVAAIWVIVCAAGAVPFMLSGSTTSFADALFESTSGFTTTGSSVFADVESLPRSILVWRSLTHWLGGMGIVVLAVAIFPALGIGGFQLLRAEAPGPDVDRLAPRIAHTARAFWAIYVLLTAVETLLLWAGPMDLFEAVNHSFATLATGGFSTRNTSVAAFSSPYTEWVITIFMLMSGVNFALYYRAITGNFRRIREDSELKVYIVFFILAAAIVIGSIAVQETYTRFGDSVRYGAFQVATLMTSTGFATADYTLWPGLARGVLLLMLLVGGCVGSTSGGIKMLHVTVLGKIVGKQLRRLAHPRAVVTVRINRLPMGEEIQDSIVAFFVLYIATVIVSTIVVASTGADLETSLTASLAAIGNVGPGFGQVGPAMNFGFLPGYAKIVLSLVMIIGRLEIYTILLLFVPGYLRGW